MSMLERVLRFTYSRVTGAFTCEAQEMVEYRGQYEMYDEDVDYELDSEGGTMMPQPEPKWEPVELPRVFNGELPSLKGEEFFMWLVTFVSQAGRRRLSVLHDNEQELCVSIFRAFHWMDQSSIPRRQFPQPSLTLWTDVDLMLVRQGHVLGGSLYDDELLMRLFDDRLQVGWKKEVSQLGARYIGTWRGGRSRPHHRLPEEDAERWNACTRLTLTVFHPVDDTPARVRLNIRHVENGEMIGMPLRHLETSYLGEACDELLRKLAKRVENRVR